MSPQNTDHSGVTSVAQQLLLLPTGQKADILGISLQIVISCLCPRLVQPKASFSLYIEATLTRCTTLPVQMSTRSGNA